MKCSFLPKQLKSQFLIIIVLALLRFGCNQTGAVYTESIQQFHKDRIEYLKSEEGFVNLAGLYWLEPGVNSFGEDSTNTIVFPGKAAPYMGDFILKDSSVYLAPYTAILIGNKPVKDTLLVYNDSTDVEMSYSSLRWFVIKRGKDIGIRLRDLKSAALDAFDSIDYYPTDPNWKLQATWKPFDPPKSVDFQNMLGMTINYPVYGAFEFEVDGSEYSLEPLGEPEPEGYFVMFYDKTSGHGTYGSGRYLYVPEPDSSGKTTVDFNKAYNPPCAFTEFATCLFPHKENRLVFFVKAGEKFSGH